MTPFSFVQYIYNFIINANYFSTVHNEEETVDEETSFHPEMSHQVFGDG